MIGRHVCSCGRFVTNSALGRASHERGERCWLDTYWRPGYGSGFWREAWWKLTQGVLTQVPDWYYEEARRLAHAGRAVLRRGGSR